MKIKVVLTYDDNRHGFGNYNKNYHRNCIDNPKDYAKLLNDCKNDEQISHCYPFGDNNRYDFTVSFIENKVQIVSKCSVYHDNEEQIPVHNGHKFINKCICCIIDKFINDLRNLYHTCIHGILNPGNAAKLEYMVDCEKCNVTSSGKIKIVDACRQNLVKKSIDC